MTPVEECHTLAALRQAGDLQETPPPPPLFSKNLFI